MEYKSSTQKSSQGQTVRIQAVSKQRATKKAIICWGRGGGAVGGDKGGVGGEMASTFK